jgi:hypothetical protein
LYAKKAYKAEGEGVAQMAQHLPRKHKMLSLTPVPQKIHW